MNAETIAMSGSILQSYHYYVGNTLILQGNGQDQYHYHFSGPANSTITLPPANAVANQSFQNRSNKAYSYVISCDQFSPSTLAVNTFNVSDRYIYWWRSK